MASQAPRPQTEYSTDTIATSFDVAHGEVLRMTADPELHARMHAEGIDPYDHMGRPPFLRIVAAFAHDKAECERREGGDPLHASTVDLVASAPAALYAQAYLDSRSTTDKKPSAAVAIVSRYHKQVRHFSAEFPATRAAHLSKAILNISNVAISSPRVLRPIPGIVNRAIRGEQHETGFGQILRHTGREVAPATTEQDMRGIDYNASGRERNLMIDVKASLSEIERLGAPGSAYALRRNGIIVMYSLIKDAEFGGKMLLPETLAEAKAPVLNQLLDAAEAHRATA